MFVRDDIASYRTRLYARTAMSRGGCLLWTGRKTRTGYGSISVLGREMRAHRAVWELEMGLIPLGLCVCHRCDNPSCVNVGHLFLGSHDDNMADKKKKGRQNLAFGERHGMSKLTSDEVSKIRQEYSAGGISQRQLADKYGVCQGQIHNVVTGKSRVAG